MAKGDVAHALRKAMHEAAQNAAEEIETGTLYDAENWIKVAREIDNLLQRLADPVNPALPVQERRL